MSGGYESKFSIRFNDFLKTVVYRVISYKIWTRSRVFSGPPHMNEGFQNT